MTNSECYVCYEYSTEEESFIKTGCACRGTLQIHAKCFKEMAKTVCPVCKINYSNESLKLLVRKELDYYEDGNLASEIGVLYDDESGFDVNHGEAKYFFNDGGLWMWYNYNKDRLCSFFRIYGKDGKLVKESYYST